MYHLFLYLLLFLIMLIFKNNKLLIKLEFNKLNYQKNTYNKRLIIDIKNIIDQT